jgi:hypothetical protein
VLRTASWKESSRACLALGARVVDVFLLLSQDVFLLLSQDVFLLLSQDVFLLLSQDVFLLLSQDVFLLLSQDVFLLLSQDVFLLLSQDVFLLLFWTAHICPVAHPVGTLRLMAAAAIVNSGLSLLWMSRLRVHSHPQLVCYSSGVGSSQVEH